MVVLLLHECLGGQCLVLNKDTEDNDLEDLKNTIDRHAMNIFEMKMISGV